MGLFFVVASPGRPKAPLGPHHRLGLCAVAALVSGPVPCGARCPAGCLHGGQAVRGCGGAAGAFYGAVWTAGDRLYKGFWAGYWGRGTSETAGRGGHVAYRGR